MVAVAIAVIVFIDIVLCYCDTWSWSFEYSWNQHTHKQSVYFNTFLIVNCNKRKREYAQILACLFILNRRYISWYCLNEIKRLATVTSKEEEEDGNSITEVIFSSNWIREKDGRVSIDDNIVLESKCNRYRFSFWPN